MQGIEIKKHEKVYYVKDFFKTIVICAFFGMFGIHRFYTGYTKIGIFQLLTLGGGLVWWLIDLLAMCFNKYKDRYGNELDEYNVQVSVFVLTALAIILLAVGIMSAPYLMGIE